MPKEEIKSLEEMEKEIMAGDGSEQLLEGLRYAIQYFKNDAKRKV